MFDQDVIGADDIARQYNACMDSVNLINSSKPSGVSADDWADVVARNKEHLRGMLAKPFWTDQDLGPILSASA